MKTLSFDIGEKNFAYCLGVTTEAGPLILSIVHVNLLSNSKQSVLQSCSRVTDILNADSEMPNVKTVLIEQQMKVNSRAVKLGQHVWSYFQIKWPEKSVILVPSSLKSRHFLGKNTLSYHQLKRWSVTKTISLLADVKNDTIINAIQKLEKQDDVCDTILQFLAFNKYQGFKDHKV